MLPYFILMSFATLFVFLEGDPSNRESPLRSAWVRALCLVALTIFVGARFDVGGDWGAYDQRIDDLRGAELASILTWDPGYDLLNWIAANSVNGNVVFVNLVCAAIFVLGLLAFCSSLPRPSLALQLALPYLVFVVGMGYTRQATAIGGIMLALAAISASKTFRPLMLMALAALFHKAAAIFIPTLWWASSELSNTRRVVILCVAGIAIALLLVPTAEYSITRYLTEDWASTGAPIRGSLNLVAAMIFLWFSSELPIATEQKNIFRIFAVGICGLSVLLLLSPTSTIVDRMGLFFLPFQIAVFSCLPNIFGNRGFSTSATIAFLVIFAWGQLTAWLYLSPFAQSWLPYQNVVFM